MRQSAPASSGAPVPAAPGPGSWFRERTWLVDLLVTMAVFLYNLPIFPLYARDPLHAVALLLVSAVICGSYLLRRRFPVGVLALMIATTSVQLLLGAPILAADAMLLLAVYNLAVRRTAPVSVLGALAAVAWLLIAVVPRLGEEFIDIGQLGVLIVLTAWVWTWGTLVRIRRQHVSGLQERAEQAERERETRARIAVAEERARIAREIHDIVSHSLSVVVLMSDGAAATVGSEPERARSAMLHVRDTGRSALAEMRRMLGVLREDEPGSDAPQPGMAQLAVLVEQSRAAGLPVALTVDGSPGGMSEGLGLTVFRIVQEALTNVRRHAGPGLRRVDVRIDCRPREVVLRVTDDGQGPGAGDAGSGGHGLLGMRERAAAHGGTLHVGAAEDGGFEVVAALPREAREEGAG
ncbi:sensor histidine kinase [Brachybacterium hainanense]|uniref:histidine kinase n=1 Tax=Brachybacterium hainanense TaxID=1541174 RepID=A0ABV6RA52_9MICO